MADIIWPFTILSTLDGENNNDTISVTGKTVLKHKHAWPTATTNQAINLEFAFAAVNAYRLVSDQIIHIYVNAASTGSPTETITFAANVPHIFVKNVLGTSEFGTNVTAGFFLTNASGSTANVLLQILIA